MYKKELPNFLTILRIALIPVLVLSFYIHGGLSRWCAVGIFIFASLTDFFDGYLARMWRTESHFGRLLDPIADKLIVVSAIVMIIHMNYISKSGIFPALAIICREILVTSMREHLSKTNVMLLVNKLSKIKTACQMAAISLLILGDFSKYTTYVQLLGEVMLWISAILTLWSGYYYFKSSMLYITEDK